LGKNVILIWYVAVTPSIHLIASTYVFYLLSGSFQKTNIRSVLALNESLFNSTRFFDVILTESKSSIEARWLDSQIAASVRIQKWLSWKRLSQNVTILTESFFASLPRSGTCVSCRNEEMLVASVGSEGGIVIPNISVAAPASNFWNNSEISSSFHMLQSTFANQTKSFGNISS
jgi:hypothetical protein